MDILERIISRKKQRLAEVQEGVPLSELYKKLEDSYSSERRLSNQDLQASPLSGETFNVIAEVKRASPSLGQISWSMDLAELVKNYEQGGAGVISVLTEEDFFLGSILDLQKVQELTTLPILRKDFLFSEYQIIESKLIGASYVLLIMALLTENQLRRLLLMVKELGMKALVECRNENEVKQALAQGAQIIGINNRDLRTFAVDLDITAKLSTLIPKEIVLVSESGIKTLEDVTRVVQAGGDAVLVGESCLKQDNPAAFIRGLLNCGLKEKENMRLKD